MIQSQKIDLAIRESRGKLLSLGARGDAVTDAEKLEFESLPTEIRAKEVEFRAAVLAEDAAAVAAAADLDRGGGDAESREVAELRSKSSVSSYVRAAVEMRAVGGPEAEFNAARGMGANEFPLGLLVPEERQTTAVDVSANQGTWLDRLFSQTAAQRLGVSFRSVGPGVASFATTTAGATAGQLDKSGAAAAAAWTIGVTELKPNEIASARFQRRGCATDRTRP